MHAGGASPSPAACYQPSKAATHDVLHASHQESLNCAHEVAELHGPVSCAVGSPVSAPHAQRADELGNLLLTITGLGIAHDRVIVDYDAPTSSFIVRAWHSDSSAATRQTLPMTRRLSTTTDVRICWSCDGRDLIIGVPYSSVSLTSYALDVDDIHHASCSVLREVEEGGEMSDSRSCVSASGLHDSERSHDSS
jgi:hypothetical protein